MKTHAVRNIRLCTKDCLCLYVCPTGATDTEDSIIDISKCVGCGACADACPSGAISMVPEEYPPQQKKTEHVRVVLNALAQRKADGEKAALQIAAKTELDGLGRLMAAVAKSERLLAEDILREAGYMLPQSDNTHALLEKLLSEPLPPEFPAEAAKKILETVPNNEKNAQAKGETKMAKWVCTVCGYVHEGEQPPAQCPVCRQPAEKFKKVEEETKAPPAEPKTLYTSSMTPEKALAAFGLGCAQHVFGEFAPQLGLARETALKIASLFGSGMFEGGTCGAVVGGLMAIGLRFGQGDDPDPARQERLQQKGAEFKARYAALYGSCVCKEILGRKIPEELEQIEAENKFVTVCSHAISDACRICAEILNGD